MSECFEKNIFGSSKKILKQEGIRDSFDLFIFTAGWESRCMEVTEYNTEHFNFDSAIIISFKDGGEFGYLPEYMDKIKSFIKSKTSSKIISIESEPTDLKKITEDLNKNIVELANDLKKPLNIGFDISSCPRYFFLYLLGYCLENGLAQNISFFYSEGKYSGDVKNYVHTQGKWDLIEVSYLEARDCDPEHKKMFVVSAGFEGNRFRSLVAKYEPDDLGILMPIPGFNEGYTEKVEKECKPMIEEFDIPDDDIVKVPAGDAIAAWDALKTASLNKKGYNITYLTFGPKPHVLAMGIHGYLNKKITVTYRMPDAYTHSEVEPTGVFWRYDIKNLIFI